MADAHTLGCARAEVCQQRVAGGSEPLDRLLRAGLSDVEADGAFVEVDALGIGPADRMGKVAARRLQLDDIGVEVSQ